MKKLFLALIICFVAGCAHGPCKKDVVFQNAPINALMAGCYTGTMSVQEIKQHGDFGLGTLDALDGELVVLGGSFYQIRSDGKVYSVDDSAKSPFAVVTFFEADQKFDLGRAVDFKELTRFLDEQLLSQNLPYAIQVDGKFETIKVRSPARQQKPYAVLSEAIKDQAIFELTDQEGTLIGFRAPPYMEGVNVSGYHFHFLSKDKKTGGHVLDFRVEKPRIEVDKSVRFSMEIPENEEFLRSDLKTPSADALSKVEK